jgi:hypothetical protein
MCQEIGHIFGLDHQDENFGNGNLGSCMDYTNDPSSNQHPNEHDYEMLDTIYSHLDTTTTIGQSLSNRFRLPSILDADIPSEIDFSNPREWGKELRKSIDEQITLFERDLGKGHKVFTFVFWADVSNDQHK